VGIVFDPEPEPPIGAKAHSHLSIDPDRADPDRGWSIAGASSALPEARRPRTATLDTDR
jgi:hypothetical protein